MKLRRTAVLVVSSMTAGLGLTVSAPAPAADAMIICYMKFAGRFQGYQTFYGCKKLSPFSEYVDHPPPGYSGNWSGRQHKWVPVVLGGQNCVTLYARYGNLKVAIGLAKSFTTTEKWRYQGYEDCR